MSQDSSWLQYSVQQGQQVSVQGGTLWQEGGPEGGVGEDSCSGGVEGGGGVLGTRVTEFSQGGVEAGQGGVGLVSLEGVLGTAAGRVGEGGGVVTCPEGSFGEVSEFS